MNVATPVRVGAAKPLLALLEAQPTATVDAAKRYSRIRSHPMIQATNSPSVA